MTMTIDDDDSNEEGRREGRGDERVRRREARGIERRQSERETRGRGGVARGEEPMRKR
jgi:hypothetical protein